MTNFADLDITIPANAREFSLAMRQVGDVAARLAPQMRMFAELIEAGQRRERQYRRAARRGRRIPSDVNAWSQLYQKGRHGV